jgi:hypothetical protein
MPPSSQNVSVPGDRSVSSAVLEIGVLDRLHQSLARDHARVAVLLDVPRAMSVSTVSSVSHLDPTSFTRIGSDRVLDVAEVERGAARVDNSANAHAIRANVLFMKVFH